MPVLLKGDCKGKRAGGTPALRKGGYAIG